MKILSPETFLVAERTYPFYSKWANARPSVSELKEELNNLKSVNAGSNHLLMTVVNEDDVSVSGVIWPLHSGITVNHILFSLAKLGAIDAKVGNYDSTISEVIARNYWDKFISTGISSRDLLRDATSEVSSWIKVGVVAAVGVGLLALYKHLAPKSQTTKPKGRVQ